MGLTNIRLGDYIERSTINNKDLKYGVDLIVGVNSQGVFATPKSYCSICIRISESLVLLDY